MEESNFRDIDWRLDMVTASRLNRSEVRPAIYIRINMKQESRLLKVDYTTLKYFADQMDLAARNLDSNYAHKLYRAFGF